MIYGLLVSGGLPQPPSGDETGWAYGSSDGPAALPDQPPQVLGAEFCVVIALILACLVQRDEIDRRKKK